MSTHKVCFGAKLEKKEGLNFHFIWTHVDRIGLDM